MQSDFPGALSGSAADIVVLGDDYLEAARMAANLPNRSSTGPTRLLLWYACVHYLKALLRSEGLSLWALEGAGKDLAALVDQAFEFGLQLPDQSKYRVAELAGRSPGNLTGDQTAAVPGLFTWADEVRIQARNASS